MSPERKIVILLVEDTMTVRFLYKRYLQEEGFEVVEAETGRKAIQQFYQARPDVVLLDLILPDMQGLEILKLIRNDEDETLRDTPVIMLTGVREIAAVQKAIQLGANYYSVKGSDPMEKLFGLIYKLLKNRHARQSIGTPEESGEDDIDPDGGDIEFIQD